MSSSLFKEMTDGRINGDTLFSRSGTIAVEPGQRYPNSALGGALAEGNVVSVSDADDISGLTGGLFLCAPKNGAGYQLTIGQPGQPGRRFKFILTGTLDSASENVIVRVGATTSVANRKMSGTIVTGDVTAGKSVKEFVNHRSVAYNGSGTGNDQPGAGDWMEFVDAGDHWYFNGVCHTRNGDVIVGRT